MGSLSWFLGRPPSPEVSKQILCLSSLFKQPSGRQLSSSQNNKHRSEWLSTSTFSSCICLDTISGTSAKDRGEFSRRDFQCDKRMSFKEPRSSQVARVLHCFVGGHHCLLK